MGDLRAGDLQVIPVRTVVRLRAPARLRAMARLRASGWFLKEPENVRRAQAVLEGRLTGPRIGVEYQIQYCESSAGGAARQPAPHYF